MATYENNNLYNSEPEVGNKITKETISQEPQFENLDYSKELDETLSKNKENWAKAFRKVNKNGKYVVANVELSITIYIECLTLHNNNLVDTVQIFHQITAFFGVDPENYFKSLLSKFRHTLVIDLSKRLDGEVGLSKLLGRI